MGRAGSTTHARSARRKSVAVVARPEQAAGTLMLTWSMSRQGAGTLASADGSGPLLLEMRVPCRGVVRAVRATLVEGETQREIAAEGSGAWALDSGLWHLDIPGVLAVSLREQPGGVEVLYARTGLLTGLGIEGGRYEFEAGKLLPR